MPSDCCQVTECFRYECIGIVFEIVSADFKIEVAAVANLTQCGGNVCPIHRAVCKGLGVAVLVLFDLMCVDDLHSATELAQSAADGVSRIRTGQREVTEVGAGAEVLASQFIDELQNLLGTRADRRADVLVLDVPHRLDRDLDVVFFQIGDQGAEELQVDAMAVLIVRVKFTGGCCDGVDDRVMTVQQMRLIDIVTRDAIEQLTVVEERGRAEDRVRLSEFQTDRPCVLLLFRKMLPHLVARHADAGRGKDLLLGTAPVDQIIIQCVKARVLDHFQSLFVSEAMLQMPRAQTQFHIEKTSAFFSPF